jgi:hypothetical protein
MLFLHRQNGLHETSGRGIVVAKVMDHIAVAIDGNALSDQVLFDHVDQQCPFHILDYGMQVMAYPLINLRAFCDI